MIRMERKNKVNNVRYEFKLFKKEIRQVSDEILSTFFCQNKKHLDKEIKHFEIFKTFMILGNNVRKAMEFANFFFSTTTILRG